MQFDNRDLLKKGLIPDWLDLIFLRSVTPFISYFLRRQTDPNALTIAGFLLNVAGCGFICAGSFLPATVAIGMGGICDFIDGKVARKSMQMTYYGDVLDDVLDRYSDVILFSGVAVYAQSRSDAPLVMMSLLTVAGALMTSYLKALSEKYRLTFRLGAVRRQERITLLFCGTLFAFTDPFLRTVLVGTIGLPANGLPPSSIPLTASIMFLAISTNMSALQRFLNLGRLVRQLDAAAKPAGTREAVLTR